MYEKRNKTSWLPHASQWWRFFNITFFIFLVSLVVLYGWPFLVNVLFSLWYEDALVPLGYYKKEITYNTVLREREETPISLIESLGKDPLLGKIHDIEELRWDFLFTQSGARDDIIALYMKALAWDNQSRLQKKLSYLTWSSAWEDIQTSSGNSQEKKIEYSSGELSDIETTRTRIRETSAHQGEYLNILAPKNESSLLRDTIDFLNTDKEHIDW